MAQIIRLGSEEKGRKLLFRYTSQYYYDVEVCRDNGWQISLIRRPFGKTVEKSFTDTLLSDWLENPRLYAAVEEGRRVGYVELSQESWNNRMRVTNLWVAEDARHRGIGTLLMAQAIRSGVEAGARAMVLETQSCNDIAISFYLRQGFFLTGFDSTAYSNSDPQNREVRLEFARLLP